MTDALILDKKNVDVQISRKISAEAITQFQQASLLLDQGKTEDALHGFKQAVQMAPNYTEALHETGNCLQDLGRPEEASQYYSRALQEIANRLCEIGRYEESQGRYWVAISRYEEACKFYQPEWVPSSVKKEEYQVKKQNDKNIPAHDAGGH